MAEIDGIRESLSSGFSVCPGLSVYKTYLIPNPWDDDEESGVSTVTTCDD